MALSLGEEINIATRPLHTTLNRLILSLFPTALPPYTASPLAYADGLSFVLPIYSTLKYALQNVPCSPSDSRIAALIHELPLQKLERTSRIESDLLLLGTPSHREQDCPLRLHAFLQHIRSVAAAKPYLLLAYTWILYLALFSGGRYLRAQLRVANTQVWHIGQDSDAPLQFWCFEGEQDGEDIKAYFKASFQHVDGVLTSDERAQVIDEGVEVMKRMIEVVQEIERTVKPFALERSNRTMLVTAQPLLLRILLPLPFLKVIGSWSWGIASGFATALRVWDTKGAPIS